MSASSPNMAATFMSPVLPEGKEYHVMFNFQSEDRNWVRKMVSKLEADPYNLKCCIADRDFHPAKIIPVIRRGKEIPNALRFINYIDARDDVDDEVIVESLARAVAEDLSDSLGVYSLASNKTLMNGDGIIITAKKHHKLLTYEAVVEKEQVDEAKDIGLKARRKTTLLACKINDRLKKLNVLVYFCINEDRPAIRIIHYDLVKCTSYIEDLLEKKMGGIMTSNAMIAEQAKALVDEQLPLYLDVLENSDPVAPYLRHRVRRDLVCFCQFVKPVTIRKYVRSLANIDRGDNSLLNANSNRNDAVVLLEEGKHPT